MDTHCRLTTAQASTGYIHPKMARRENTSGYFDRTCLDTDFESEQRAALTAAKRVSRVLKNTSADKNLRDGYNQTEHGKQD